MKVCEICRKELKDDMVCVSVNIYGKLRVTSNDISGLGNADREFDYCTEHGMKVVDGILRINEEKPA